MAAERPDASAERAQQPPDVRGSAVAQLAGVLAALAAAGDLEGARDVYATIGRLLAPPPARGEGAAVVDLEAERQRRAGR